LMATSGGLTLYEVGSITRDVGPTYAFQNAPMWMDVLSGTFSANAGLVSIVSWTQGTNGAVAYTNHDYSISYTPSTATPGWDTFTITATDGTDTATAYVSVDV